ncbi:MAG: repeat domain protein [Myxococcaceae bacterium]|nr:repeat domain protein [Myxococcaceae bacterium]
MLLVLLLLTAAPADPEPALARLARAVAEQSSRATPEAPVAIHVEAPTPALARAFASLLAAELAARKLSPVVLEAPSPAVAERLARERDLRSLVRVSLAAENTRLVARGDVLPTWVNFWAGSTPTRSGPAAAVAATVDADLQAMTLVLARLAAPPAAIAVADLDGDKRGEIVVLTDDELLVLAADGKTIARADLRSLPPAARPTRESFGAISLQPGRIAWLSGRRAHGEALTFAAGALKSAGPIDELALDGVTVKAVPGINAFAAEASWFGKPVTLPAPLTTTNSRGGSSLFLFANGTGAITRGVPPVAVFSGAPSAAVIADLDGDGSFELLATSARSFPDGDEVKVLPIAAVEALAARAGSLSEGTPVWSGTTPRGRVLCAAAGDLDGDGAEEVVLGSWLADGTGELHLARRIAP